ncbi:MAG: tRNA lysidine(34) synthetase TilS [Scytonematopsis contorta HA4267-MV1]|jgi:tRNA(Ile)-lysidine synthase|nr:tRNA lysidine(34) synthetase TilS [Scytonematopsis contorta HA4267-MV1]
MTDSHSWTLLHTKINRTIRERNLFQHHQNLLLAVSGGQDSLCLAKLLLDLQAKWEWHLGIIHCDHRWRNDSEANANHVANLAKIWGIPFYLETATEVIESEASARNWRYKVLSKIAIENNYECILTGHTASDRAETLLYNLIRGTGADGLQALTWKRPLTDDITKKMFLVRPLLEITRTQTQEFCQEFQLPVWLDSTNQDLKYARNRIRQELLPYLQENFNPKVESALAQTAELLQAEVDYLEEAATRLREEVLNNSKFKIQNSKLGSGELGVGIGDKRVIKLNRQILKKAPLALQRRVMRQVLQEILPSSPNFEHIEKLTALITAPNRSQTDPFPSGVIAKVENEWILIGE